MKMLPGGVQLIQETGHLPQMRNMTRAIRSHFTFSISCTFPEPPWEPNSGSQQSRRCSSSPKNHHWIGCTAAASGLPGPVPPLELSAPTDDGGGGEGVRTTEDTQCKSKPNYHDKSANLFFQLRVFLYQLTGSFHICRKVLLGQKLLKDAERWWPRS